MVPSRAGNFASTASRTARWVTSSGRSTGTSTWTSPVTWAMTLRWLGSTTRTMWLTTIPSGERLDLDRQDRGQVPHDRGPRVPGVVRGVDLAAAGAEVDPAGLVLVDRHRVAEHVDVAVLLREPLRECLPLLAAGAAAVDP